MLGFHGTIAIPSKVHTFRTVQPSDVQVIDEVEEVQDDEVEVESICYVMKMVGIRAKSGILLHQLENTKPILRWRRRFRWDKGD